MVGGGGGHLVAAQCGRRGRGHDPREHPAAAAFPTLATSPPAPCDPLAVGQCLSPWLGPHPGGAAQSAAVAPWALRARTLAQRHGRKTTTQSDPRGAPCGLKTLPL